MLISSEPATVKLSLPMQVCTVFLGYSKWLVTKNVLKTGVDESNWSTRNRTLTNQITKQPYL